MKRRGFLKSILAVSTAPAIVKAQSLMKITSKQILVPSYNNPLLPLEEIIASQQKVLIGSNSSKILWPGINAWYGNLYWKGL